MWSVNERFLQSNGFKPHGDPRHREFNISIPDVETKGEEQLDKEGITLLFSVSTQELFIESTNTEGDTVGLSRIPTPDNPDKFLTLLDLLGAR